MNNLLDRNLFTQIGLDSGAVTMLGSVVHRFGEAGEYRGTVRSGDRLQATFYISVDPGCAVAELLIDLAKLTAPRSPQDDCCGEEAGKKRFIVHPRGYAVFHVSSGAGGYHVNIRRADEKREVPAYDTRALQPQDIFAGVLLRPGTYTIRNLLTHASAEATVSYPVSGETAYRPPAPMSVEVGDTIEPRHLELRPAQGFNMHVKVPARIKIELTKPDDGPSRRPAAGRPGLQRHRLPGKKE